MTMPSSRRAEAMAAVAVAVLAFVFRWPSCGESLWLDELHSAWTVADSFGEVGWRAAHGNQTTFYFQGLWLWAVLLGDGEALLRLSSVVASCCAAGLLVIGVSRRSGSLAGGLVAGGVFSLDSHAVFFGCELRPYAFLFPCAVVAVWALMRWIAPTDRSTSPAIDSEMRARFVMVLAVAVAALTHPTSLGVLGWLLAVGFLVAIVRGRFHWGRWDTAACLLAVLTGTLLALSSLPDSWQHRNLWKAFGQAYHWNSLWYAWDWVTLLGAPVVAAGVLWCVSQLRPAADSRRSRGVYGLVPGLVGVVGTFGYFVASYYQFVPLWHRRYYVTALPLLCWTAGEMAGVADAAIGRLIARRRSHGSASERNAVSQGSTVSRGNAASRGNAVFSAVTVAVLFVGFQLWHSGMLPSLAEGRVPLQLRGEDWRGAVASLQAVRAPGDPVWLDSGLIEAEVLRDAPETTGGLTLRERAYLVYPLGGPYRIDDAVAVAGNEHPLRLRQHLQALSNDQERVWLICRAGRRGAERLIERVNQHRTARVEQIFSGVPSVFRLDFAATSTDIGGRSTTVDHVGE